MIKLLQQIAVLLLGLLLLYWMIDYFFLVILLIVAVELKNFFRVKKKQYRFDFKKYF